MTDDICIALETLPDGQVRLRLDRVMLEKTADQIMALILAEKPPDRLSTLTPEEDQENYESFLEMAAKLKAEPA